MQRTKFTPASNCARWKAGSTLELAGMRVNEEIDAIEAFSIDSFKLLVVPRILACIVALPLLTVFMDVAGLAGGFLAERISSHISLHLYLNRAFSEVEWGTFIPPTLKTAVFGHARRIPQSL